MGGGSGRVDSVAQFSINENNLGLESLSWMIVNGKLYISRLIQVFHSETVEQKYLKTSTALGRKNVELLIRRSRWWSADTG